MRARDHQTDSCCQFAQWLTATLLLNASLAGPALEAYAADRPAVVFHETRFDFGSSVQGTLIEHDFVLTNEGSTPLRIGRSTSRHHCLSRVFQEKSRPEGEPQSTRSWIHRGCRDHSQASSSCMRVTTRHSSLHSRSKV